MEQILPKCFRPVIVAIDSELKDEYNAFKSNNDLDALSGLIGTLLNCYSKTIYKNIYGTTAKNGFNIEDINKFIKTLSEAINYFEHNNELYTQIIEMISIFLKNTIMKLQVQYCIENNINDISIEPISACEYCESLSKIKYSADELKAMLPYFYDHQNCNVAFIYNEDKKTLIIDGIKYIDIPVSLISNLTKISFRLNSYKEFITTKLIKFVQDETIIATEDNDAGLIIISNDYLYNIIYYLMKDKLCSLDLTFWRDRFAKLLMNRYIADDSYLFEHKFYSSRSELSYQEYFMSCIIEFILDKDLLYNTDLEAYNEVNKILNKVFITKQENDAK
jgi:hypothetical protein